MMKWLDLPPVWLALSVAVVWGFDQLMPWGMFGPGARMAGAVLAVIGFGLIGLAAGQMIARKTTFIPRNDPSALVTTGLFRLTRNPIYLGDAMVLAAAILWWDVPVGVPVLLGFMMLIQHRFILDEEARLRSVFGAAFDAWAARVPRWIGFPKG